MQCKGLNVAASLKLAAGIFAPCVLLCLTVFAPRANSTRDEFESQKGDQPVAPAVSLRPLRSLRLNSDSYSSFYVTFVPFVVNFFSSLRFPLRLF